MFAQRLKELRAEKAVKQEDVADFLGISKSAYGYYESSRNMPSVEMLLNLSNYFLVSTDYLLGRSDDRNSKKSDGSHDSPIRANQDDILDKLKNDPLVRLVAKIHGDLTEEGKKDLLKYAELLKNQRDKGWDD
mgnify:CR=1 FL=1